jgi:hypothetical protein
MQLQKVGGEGMNMEEIRQQMQSEAFRKVNIFIDTG